MLRTGLKNRRIEGLTPNVLGGQSTYYLRSSVIDEIVEEINSSGQKNVGYVRYPGGELLAQQSGASVTWKYTTPAGTSRHDLFSGGGSGRMEFDPLGADISLEGPITPDTGGGQGDIGANHLGGIMSARWSNFFDQSGGCSSIGYTAACHGVTSPNAYLDSQNRSFFGDSWYDLPGNNNERERAEIAYAKGVFIVTTISRLLKSKPGNTSDPTEITAYQAAMADLINRILSRADCANLYGGVEQAVGTLAGTSFSVENLGYAQLMPNGNLYSSSARTVNSSIEINRQGSFFSGSTVRIVSGLLPPAVSLSGQVYTWGLQGSDWQALILAHELGHRVRIYGKNDIDGNNQTLNAANTQKVFDACFK